jgi:hypothetical protein
LLNVLLQLANKNGIQKQKKKVVEGNTVTSDQATNYSDQNCVPELPLPFSHNSGLEYLLSVTSQKE